MTNLSIQYLIDIQGNPNAVVIAIAIWQQIFHKRLNSVEILTESIKDYCLNRAMNEALKTEKFKPSKSMMKLLNESLIRLYSDRCY